MDGQVPPHGISALGKGFLQMAVSGHPAGQDNFLKSCRNKSFLAFGYKNVHNGFLERSSHVFPLDLKTALCLCMKIVDDGRFQAAEAKVIAVEQKRTRKINGLRLAGKGEFSISGPPG